MRRLGNLAIQPSNVQYGLSRVRGEVEVGRLYDDGFLFLNGDPGVWIQSNPDSVSSVRSLELFLWFYKGERIGDSIGELSQLTHLSIYGGLCNLKCLPNTLSRLHNLHHLELEDCQKLEDLPPNLGDLYNLTYLSLKLCDSLKLIESVAKLSNLTTLVISNLEELPPNLGGLYNLKSLSLEDCHNYVIESVTKLSNLTTLTICDDGKLQELPANLGDFKFLASLSLNYCYRLRWLPWSITKLSNLRFLYLPQKFRLETLPPHLNDSIIISVAKAHIRKTWKELKTHVTETLSYQFPIIPEELTAQKTSTPAYLQFIGDPTLWIRDYGSHSSLRVLDLDLGVSSCKGKIPDSIAELLPQLTHLYISNGCLPHHLPPTFSRLTHLSLIGCTFKCHTISHFDSLGNLSTLTSLHLYQRYKKLLPEHMDLPMSLTHLSLDFCYSSFPDSHMASMAKLSNLNTLTLSHCGDLESLPLHLNLTKLILRNTTIKSLPIGLKHLEIIHVICRGEYCNKLQECWRNQLVNLETLSYTCSEIESLLSLTSLHNLRELQLKDCFSLKELPQDLHKLVKLCTLDVSGTRIQSLPSSIINLYNLQCLILPKCFILKSLPDDFGNKVMISVDDTDESYYKHQGYHNRGYGIIKDCDYMTSDSINEINKKFLEKFKPDATVTVIEQASQHRPSNHQPDATRIIEGSQFNGSTDPTSNNNPNASISSPNHEIENLPTSNEAGTIPVVVNECYSDVNANTMQDHDPMDIDEVGENNSHAHAIFGSRNQETETLKSNNWDGVMTTFVSDIPAEPSFNLQQTNSFGENNQQFFQNEHQIDQGLELQQDSEEDWLQYYLSHLSQSDPAQPFSGSHFIGSADPTTNNNPNASITSPNHEIENLLTSNEAGTIPVVVNECHSDVNANKVQDHDPMDIADCLLSEGNNAVGLNNSHAHAILGSQNQETQILQSNNCDNLMTSVSDIGAEPSFSLPENNSFGENNQQFFQNEHQIYQGLELQQDSEEDYLQYLPHLFQSDSAQPFSVGENNSYAIFSSQLQENEGIHLNRGNNAVGENNSHAPANFGSHNQETEILQSNNWDGVMTTSVSNIAAEPSFNLHENNLFGENSQQVFQNERIDNSQSGDVQRKSGTTQKKEIPLERIEELMSQGLTVKVAAQQLGVSKSTLKRRLKEHGITWQSSRKQNPPADKNRNETHSTCKRNLSQQLNSVDHSDRGSHGQGVEDLAGPSQGPTLSYHLSSEHNAVNDSTPDVVTRTVGESPLSTQMCMDSHQRVEEHLNDGAAEHALVNTDLPPNERCSTFAVKAIFNEDIVRFNFSLSSSFANFSLSSSFAKLQEIVGKKLDLKVGTFKIKYLDDENEWVRMDDLSDLELAVSLSRSRSNVVRLSITKT